ncbi:bacterioferritin [Pseudoalteromonas tunicata]|jgi:bacterioferritin|uniref:Bacterioferritin n=1 Tax=Pseudoalteromonas tunicata D2 TaxID=87626 RepID=A4C4I5_9GAMM|nr:bacterioferritin [Pseudoalteromonas tunicata]ATC97050.1 bacterioferritin [Pseudoalteromonas tunicata]AXT33168.1 bacterioferritin [Pseudoalteromonas tunicata]EAR30467.1 bacterioferritin subunit 1 [Pseudoalteromonas tunicata D2]MDP4984252.1 bacterioferritin [Pseudoalteromonas tunicata]MDP5214938.1 bacterioferritin [Pseudoalteromonas tunicata]
MKGSQAIINRLNQQLTLELSSMDQYLAHSKLYQDWGINKLHQQLSHEYEEELEHAQKLIDRILFLEGTADTASRVAINVGDTVEQMLKNDLQAEYKVAESLRSIITFCEQQQDYVTRNLLQELLNDTETDHIYWLEQHLGLIERIGIANYIQSQMSATK